MSIANRPANRFIKIKNAQSVRTCSYKPSENSSCSNIVCANRDMVIEFEQIDIQLPPEPYYLSHD